jgi:hypothetical protein
MEANNLLFITKFKNQKISPKLKKFKPLNKGSNFYFYVFMNQNKYL